MEISKEGEQLIRQEDVKIARERAYIRIIKEQRKQYDHLKNNLIPLIVLWIKKRWGGDKK